jgi:membrane fusion protein (multidrug efflux system)
MQSVKSTKSIVIVMICGLAVLVGAVGLKYVTGQSSSKQSWGGMAATPVVTVEVAPFEFANIVEAIGTARANESVDVMTRVTDTISRIAFDDAGSVEAGDILVELTDAEEAAALIEARAGLDAANKHYARIQDLVVNRTTSQARLDEALSERDRGRARVKALEAKMADLIIRAPFAGVLGLRQVSVGSLVRPGDLITTLDDISVIKLDFSVSERYLANVATGQSIKARNVAWPGIEFEGEVRSVDSRIDPVTRAVMVRAIVPNTDGRLRPGMLLSIELIMDRREALGIPEAALVPVKDSVTVWVVDEDNKAQKRPVVIGLRVKGMVEVLEGLSQGEPVIIEGVHNIRRPGQQVKLPGDAPEKARGGKSPEKKNGEKKDRKPGDQSGAKS